jgi:hypothetical protein
VLSLGKNFGTDWILQAITPNANDCFSICLFDLRHMPTTQKMPLQARNGAPMRMLVVNVWEMGTPVSMSMRQLRALMVVRVVIGQVPPHTCCHQGTGNPEDCAGGRLKHCNG